MASIYTPHFAQFFDDNGAPLSGGLLYTYSAGTTTPKATYTTAAADVESANPIVLDAAGRAIIFISGSYKFVLHDSDDVAVSDGTTDNVTAFNATTATTEGFFESLSGDGVETDYTLSESLGSDENALMVFAEIEAVTNGTFAADTNWTKGTGWTISGGVATATGAISTALEQTSAITLIAGKSYTVSFTITRSAGSITLSLGGEAGTARSADGTFNEVIVAGTTQDISFGTSGFTGTVDNVTIREVGGALIQNPNTYTINGAAFTFTTPPAIGTGNALIYAPYTLINAAGAAQTAADAAIAAQAAAELAETGAETAETNAVAAAASVVGLDTTSTTSLAIATGSKVFTVDASKGFLPGMYLIAVSDADVSNYMHGQVTTYSGTTLTLDIQDVGGSGTFADWTISLSGTQGAQGAAGTISNIGSQPTATITATDKLIFADVSDSDASKNDTVQGILDLTTGGLANNGYKSGNYYFGFGYQQATADTPAANRMYARVLVIGADVTIDELFVETTNATSGNMRFGIYNFANGVPTSLIYDSGAIATSSAGVKSVTATQFLAAGVYALVYWADAAVQIKPVLATNNFTNDFFGNTVANSDNNAGCYANLTFTAFPSTFPTIDAYSSNASSCGIYFTAS